MPDSPPTAEVGIPEWTHIRSCHSYAFRSGQWAQILTVAPDPEGRDCYMVRFEDGETDFWVVNDPDAEYEFLA